MAVTAYQREICRLIATNRIAQGTSYVAGGVALNTLIGAARISKDIDLFHDTDEAVRVTWEADRALLSEHRHNVRILRERPSFVEAIVSKEQETVLVQWARDSAFRFFPLVQDDIFGLALHPFDLATNKALALVGRLEVRDWIDFIGCHQKIQNAGYLFWAACGKDPGFSPAALLGEAKRSGRYSNQEVAELLFEGPPPDAADLGRQWHAILKESESLISLLPAEEVGKCVLDSSGELFRGGAEPLEAALTGKVLRFHAGTIRGALPQIIG